MRLVSSIFVLAALVGLDAVPWPRTAPPPTKARCA